MMFGNKITSLASKPGYDPTTGTIPSTQPNATMQSVQQLAAAKRAARKAARAGGEQDLTAQQKNTLASLQAAQAKTDGGVRLAQPGMRNPIYHQTLPALSTKDQIESVGLPAKDHVASQAESYIIVEDDTPPTRQDEMAEAMFYQFEDAMTESGVYAGIAATFKELEEGAYRHIIVDTSGSMQCTDTATDARRSSDDPNEPVFLQPLNVDPSWNNVPNGANRIGEAKARLKAAISNYLRANTEGTVFFETFSREKDTNPEKYRGYGHDRFGTLTLDTTVGPHENPAEKYNNNLRQANQWIDNLDYDNMDTPTATMLYKAGVAAVNEGRLAKTKITLMTDGAASDRLSDLPPNFQREFRAYEAEVAKGRRDFINAKGQQVPNGVAKHWYMDADTREIDRVISFIIGKFAIPTVIAACTNDHRALGELNEMDGYHSGQYSALAVLDDPKSEALEYRVHNPWLKFTPNLANIFLWIAAEMRELDLLDERPLTVDEKEKITGYQINLDNAESELKGTELAVKAAHTKDKIPGESGGLVSRLANMKMAS